MGLEGVKRRDLPSTFLPWNRAPSLLKSIEPVHRRLLVLVSLIQDTDLPLKILTVVSQKRARRTEGGVEGTEVSKKCSKIKNR